MAAIRKAEPKDYLPVLQLGEKMAAHGWYDDIPFERGLAYKMGVAYASSPQACFLVAEDEDGICGFLLGHVDHYLFSPLLMAEEFMVFVEPNKRKGIIGLKLMREFIRWAKSMGAREVFFAPSMNAEEPEEFAKFSERLGFVRTGAVYRRKL